MAGLAVDLRDVDVDVERHVEFRQVAVLVDGRLDGGVGVLLVDDCILRNFGKRGVHVLRRLVIPVALVALSGADAALVQRRIVLVAAAARGIAVAVLDLDRDVVAAGSDTFRRTVRRSFALRYSVKSTSTSVTTPSPA